MNEWETVYLFLLDSFSLVRVFSWGIVSKKEEPWLNLIFVYRDIEIFLNPQIGFYSVKRVFQ